MKTSLELLVSEAFTSATTERQCMRPSLQLLVRGSRMLRYRRHSRRARAYLRPNGTHALKETVASERLTKKDKNMRKKESTWAVFWAQRICLFL